VRLRAAADAFVSNAVNSYLRRAQLSFLGAWTAEWAFTVALGIVAYRDGGATAVGLVGLLRMAPSALADRGRGERVLIGVSTVRGIATWAAGIVVAVGGPVAIVYLPRQSRAGDVHRLRHGADIYAGCTDSLHCRRCTGSVTYRRARCWNTDRCHWRWCSGRLFYCIPVSGIAAAC
jgi:hypothetical protein